MSEGGISFKKEGESTKKKAKVPKSQVHNIMVGQSALEAGEVDKVKETP